MLCEFLQEYPDVNINLDFSSHRIDLIEDEFDLAFRMGKLEDAGFIARKLLDLTMVTLASPAYIERYGDPEHPRELSEHHCLSGSVKKWSYRNIHSPELSFDAQIRGQLECKNGRVMLLGALAGNGIIRVPLIYCQQEVQQGRLRRVLKEWEIPDVEFSALYHRDRYQPNRLRTLIEFMKSYFENLRG